MAVQINTMDDESYLILHHSRSLSCYLQAIAHQEKINQTKQVSYDLEQYSMETTNVNV